MGIDGNEYIDLAWLRPVILGHGDQTSTTTSMSGCAAA